jgi:Phosphopantetheine attachment site
VVRVPDAEGRHTDWSPERIAALIDDVLGVSESAVDEDFFALGGDSILALEVVSRLNATRRQGTPAMSATDLYSHSTPRRLAAHLQSLRGTAADMREREAQTTHPGFGLNQAAFADLVSQLSAAHTRS